LSPRKSADHEFGPIKRTTWGERTLLTESPRIQNRPSGKSDPLLLPRAENPEKREGGRARLLEKGKRLQLKNALAIEGEKMLHHERK